MTVVDVCSRKRPIYAKAVLIHIPVIAMILFHPMDVFFGCLRRHATVSSRRLHAAPRARPWPCVMHRHTHRRWLHPATSSKTARLAPSSCLARRLYPPDRERTRCQVASGDHLHAWLQALRDIESRSSALRSPKNSQFLPFAPRARRSCRNARNGAMPVPGPIIMMGASAFGSLNFLFGWM